MTKSFDQVSPSSRIILFLSLNCEACQQLESELPEIDGVEFVKYWVMPSRVDGKYNLRAQKNVLDGVPLIVDADELPSLPAAFDPNTKEMAFGIDGIHDYLEGRPDIIATRYLLYCCNETICGNINYSCVCFKRFGFLRQGSI